MANAYGYDRESTKRIDRVVRQHLGGKRSGRPVSTRRTPRLSGGGQGNLIYAQVVGSVGSGDPTFSFDNAIAFVGRAPTGGTGTAQNNYAETLADNDWVWLAQRRDNDQWYLDRAAGSSGSQVVYFTLTEDKALADDDALADVGGSTIYVVDEDNRYVGKTGYKGTAFKFEDDHASSGHPGYRIIEMETPAAWLVVELYENVSGGSAQCYVADPGVYGLPHAGKPPVLTEDKLEVYDDLENTPAADAVTGDYWVARYDADADHYIFWLPFTPPAEATNPIRHALLLSVVSAATLTGTGTSRELTPGSVSGAASGETGALLLKWTTKWVVDTAYGDGGYVTVKNSELQDVRGSATDPVPIAGELVGTGESAVLRILPFDLSAKKSFDLTKDQSLGHDASGRALWQDDTECP